MKLLAVCGFIALQLVFNLTLCAADNPVLMKVDLKLTDEESAEVKKMLQEFDSGKLGLDEITSTKDNAKKIVAYFLAHTNDVSVKMKLPISRVYAGFQNYPAAAALAKDYLNVYTNDARGWDILGAANIMLDSYDEALSALTNAVRYGSDRNLIGLCKMAMETKRFDVLETLALPRMLIAKDAKE